MESRTATGTIGGRYRIRGLLGEGGMARVLDAFDDRLERPVAVKVLRPETEVLPGMRKRFQQEARLSARLIHPNIVAVLDYGEDHASSYLVMERLPGTTLRDEMARGPMAAPRLVLVMTETLAALAAAHKFGVLHRDVKPSNILLQDDGHTKLSDFGIAKSVDLASGGEVDGRHDADGSDPGHSRLPRAGAASGPPGDRTVRPVLGRRRPGGSVHGTAGPRGERSSRTRCLPGSVTSPRRALATDPNQRFPSAEAMLHALRPSRPNAVAAPPLPTERLAPVPVATLPLPAVLAPAHPERATLHRTPPVGGLAPPRRARRRRLFLAALVAAALLVSLVLLAGRGRPTAPTAGATSHHAAHRRRPGGHGHTAARDLSRRRGPARRPRAGGRARRDGRTTAGATPDGVGGERPVAGAGAPGGRRPHAGRSTRTW